MSQNTINKLQVAMDSLLPAVWNWPQVLAWVARQDPKLVQQVGDDGGDPRREVALLLLLAVRMEGIDDDQFEGLGVDVFSYISASQAEITGAKTAALDALVHSKLAAYGVPLRISLESAGVRQIPSEVWLHGEIFDGDTDGLCVSATGPASKILWLPSVRWAALRFRRDDVLAVWPPTSIVDLGDARIADDAPPTPATQRRSAFSFARSDEALVERALLIVHEKKVSVAKAADEVVGDGSGVLGGGTPQSKATRIAKRVSERLNGQ